jgi:hypothetical protein
VNLLHLDLAGALSLAVSVVIPLLSSLLSRAHWPAEVSGLLTLLLSGATGFLTEWGRAGAGFNWHAAAAAAVVSFVIAVLSRYGLWKDTATDAALLNIGSVKPAVQPAYTAQHAGTGSDPDALTVEPMFDGGDPNTPGASTPAAAAGAQQ